MSNQKYNPKWDPKNEDFYNPVPANTDEKKPDVRMVWLLNLIPYSGAGYFYALGFQQAIKPMVCIWFFLFCFGPGTLLPMYFILSVLGTAHILNKNRSTVNKLRQTTFGKERDSVSSGQQIPMSASSEFSLSTLEGKAKKADRALKRMSTDDDEAKSKHAFEAFEYKAQAAEKMLKARSEAEAAATAAATAQNRFDPDPAINFAPAAAPKFSDEDQSTAPSVVPMPSADSTDYITQVGNSYSIDAEVASITAGVDSGATANSTEVNDFLVQESKGVQSPNMVPDVVSQVAQSNSYVPEVAAQYSTEPLALPSNDISIPGISAPDVSSQVVQSNQSVPDVSSMLVNSTQSTPDVSSQLPNTSLGNFESPKFSFSFEDHMSAPITGAATSAATAAPCPKCGAAKDSNFSFCLACGQNF